MNLYSTGTGIPTHPAASLFPLLEGDDYQQLKDDIEKHGLLEPIWLCDGQILDGRNRFRACEELGIKPEFRSYEGDSPIEYVWSLNGVRRHLSKSQRAAIAVEMLPHLETEAKARSAANLKHGDKTPDATETLHRGRSVAIAGEKVGVGSTLISRAKQVKEADPKLFEKVKSGEVQVEPALRQIKTGKPAPQKPKSLPTEQRAKQIRDLAKQGNRAEQIASELGLSAERVRQLARDHNIKLADAQLGKTRRIKARRVIEQTVSGLAGYAMGLQTINGEITDIVPSDAAEWVASLSESLPPLQKLKRKLQGIANGD
jgi:hypothetical protein